MKVLLIHNYYQKIGGEDIAYEQEKELLLSQGHTVECFTRHNNNIGDYSSIKSGLNTIWNFQDQKVIEMKVKVFQPEIVHIHNTFPIISPSVYFAVSKLKVPVIQTIHNFRFFCINGLFFRDDHTCEECTHCFFPFPAIKYQCYRDNRLASVSASSMLFFHNVIRTWKNKIDGIITLSNFSKQKFIDFGFEEKKIYIKKNFLSQEYKPTMDKDTYGMYAGRITRDKGVLLLLEALNKLANKIPFLIVGEGDTELMLRVEKTQSHIKFLGFKERKNVLNLIRKSAFLVYPSQLYETNPLTIIESLAMGTPVIACDNGSMSEMVDDGKTGLLFKLGSSNDLSEKISWMISHPDERKKMSINARLTYEKQYNEEINYNTLMNIYENVINEYRS